MIDNDDDEFRENHFESIQRENGVYVVSANQTILFITEDGKITLEKNIGGDIVELFEDRFLVKVDGHMKLVPYDDLKEQ